MDGDVSAAAVVEGVQVRATGPGPEPVRAAGPMDEADSQDRSVGACPRRSRSSSRPSPSTSTTTVGATLINTYKGYL